MNITTKYNVGDELIFLHGGSFCRNKVLRLTILVTMGFEAPLVTYFFSDMRGTTQIYKYENEVSDTKEGLTVLLPVIVL